MEDLEAYVKRLKTYTAAKQRKDILQIVKKHEHQFVDANTSQLMEGKDSKGNNLEPYMSGWYAEFKLHLNPLGVTDLKLTGAFQGKFFIKVDKFPISLWSKDSKTSMLVSHYGEDIFGVSDKNLESIQEQGLNQDIEEYYNFLQVQ